MATSLQSNSALQSMQVLLEDLILLKNQATSMGTIGAYVCTYTQMASRKSQVAL